jgi:hypothetical protein
MVRASAVTAVLRKCSAAQYGSKEVPSRNSKAARRGSQAKLAAAMKVHSVPHFLTFNTPEFWRYSGIVILSPQDVLAAPGRESLNVTNCSGSSPSVGD